MIAKSSARAGARGLAAHLVNAEHNESVTIGASRDLVRDDSVAAALAEMEAIAKGARCKSHLYHVMLNPEQTLSPDQWERAWQAYESEFGLQGQPFIEVAHTKEGRAHVHRVYDRITDDGTAVTLDFSRVRNEKVARILECEFGHDLTPGKHNRAVMARLRQEGRADVADWMEHGRAAEVTRPVAEKDHSGHQIESRTGFTIERVKDELGAAWRGTGTGAEFRAAIEEAGYVLARGDKRDFVVLDPEGAAHSPARRIEGAKAKDIRGRLADLDAGTVPSVDEARAIIEARQVERERDEGDAGQARPAAEPDQEAERQAEAEREAAARAAEIERERAEAQAEKEAREAEREKARELVEPTPAEDPTPSPPEVETPDPAPTLWGQVRAAAGRAVGWLRHIFNAAAEPEREKEQERESGAPAQPPQVEPPPAPSRDERDQAPPQRGRKYEVIDLDDPARDKEPRQRRGIRMGRESGKGKEKGRELSPDDDKPGPHGGEDDDPFSG